MTNHCDKSENARLLQSTENHIQCYHLCFPDFLVAAFYRSFLSGCCEATHSSFDIVTKLNLLPGKNTLENYTTMQSHVNIWRGFLNSLCVAVPFTFFTGYFGALTAFGFCKVPL